MTRSNPSVIRVLGPVRTSGVAQAGIPGHPAPDLAWRIGPSAVEKLILDALVSCAKGRRGAGGRLLRKLRDFGLPLGAEGAVPERAEQVAVGTWCSGSHVVGFVVWFDKIPDGELAACPSGDPGRICRSNVLFRA